MNLKWKQPIIIAASDTLALDDEYVAHIRLGNRTGDRIEVILGDPHDSLLYLKKEWLPKSDSITAVLKQKVIKVGIDTVKGIIIEVLENPNQLLIHPFQHTFFVENRKVQSEKNK